VLHRAEGRTDLRSRGFRVYGHGKSLQPEPAAAGQKPAAKAKPINRLTNLPDTIYDFYHKRYRAGALPAHGLEKTAGFQCRSQPDIT
jgi:hypothetical protein